MLRLTPCLELDEFPSTRSPSNGKMLLPDVQISKGPIPLRLVGARISDARAWAIGGSIPTMGSLNFTVSVD